MQIETIFFIQYTDSTLPLYLKHNTIIQMSSTGPLTDFNAFEVIVSDFWAYFRKCLGHKQITKSLTYFKIP